MHPESAAGSGSPKSPRRSPPTFVPFSFSVIDIARGKDCLVSTNPGYFSCAAFDNPPSLPGGSPTESFYRALPGLPPTLFRQMFLPSLQAGHAGIIHG